MELLSVELANRNIVNGITDLALG